MKKNKFVVLPASLMIMMSCAEGGNLFNETSFIGEWHEIMPVNKHILQGVVFEKDGKASSVGMATLKYNGWELLKNGKECSIVLSGESIGNGQTIQFSDTLNVVSLNNDTLTLGKGDMYRIQYVKSENPEGQLIGGSDAAMGYTYSKVLDKKIRIFEEGSRLLSATDPNATMAAYSVFSADSSKVELFLPGGAVVLDKHVRPNGTAVWNVEDDDTYMVEKYNDEWLVTRRGKLLYATSGTDNSINAEFTGKNGENLFITFFNNAGVAQMNYNGVDYLLYQYRTASGYGYKNAFADIRGKGKNMTLTLSGSESIEFTEK